MEDKSTMSSPGELADWLGLLEDKVWAAARDAAATRFLLGNLVLALGKAGVIDAARFIENLLVLAPLHPDQPQAAQELLAELQRCLPSPAPNDEGGAPGDPTVFH